MKNVYFVDEHIYFTNLVALRQHIMTSKNWNKSKWNPWNNIDKMDFLTNLMDNGIMLLLTVNE